MSTAKKAAVKNLDMRRKEMMRVATKHEMAADKLSNSCTALDLQLRQAIMKHGAQSIEAKIISSEKVAMTENILALRKMASDVRQVAVGLSVDCAATRTLHVMTEVTASVKSIKQTTSTAEINKTNSDFKTSVQQLRQSTQMVTDTVSSMSITDKADAENLVNDTEKEIDEDIQIKMMRLKSVPLTAPASSNEKNYQTTITSKNS